MFTNSFSFVSFYFYSLLFRPYAIGISSDLCLYYLLSLSTLRLSYFKGLFQGFL